MGADSGVCRAADLILRMWGYERGGQSQVYVDGEGGANRKGRSVRCAWADSEELRPGREGPQRTLDTGRGGLGSSDLSLPPRRCCHNPASSACALAPMTGPCLTLVRSKGHWPSYACAPLRPPSSLTGWDASPPPPPVATAPPRALPE